jgi:Ca2+/Na+ antiporter
LIADITGLGNTFVGSAFIAISTSLPELVVSIHEEVTYSI